MSDLREMLLKSFGQLREETDCGLPDSKGRFEGKKILLAEDNELNREIAIEVLGEYGFSIDVAENGEEALDKVSASEPGDYDLVLMDIQMPVMDGFISKPIDMNDLMNAVGTLLLS